MVAPVQITLTTVRRQAPDEATVLPILEAAFCDGIPEGAIVAGRVVQEECGSLAFS